MRFTLLCLAVSGLCSAAGIPGTQVQWISHPSTKSGNNASWGRALNDIKNHEPSGQNYTNSDLVTNGHETTHGINNYFMNKHSTAKKSYGFYVLNDKAAVFEEPNFRTPQMKAYVPSNLRGSRYSTYIDRTTGWEDRPLYLFDEWVSYTNGTEVCVDLAEKGLWRYGWRDCASGAVEFVPYVLAELMAMKNLDPNYFAQAKNLKEFVAWNIQRVFDLYNRTLPYKDFDDKSVGKNIDELQKGSAAQAMRDFAMDLYGPDWTYMVMGF